MRLLTLLCLSLFALAATAQNTFNYDISLSNPLAPVATWSTSPAGAVCTASGDWSGVKASSGSEVLGRVDSTPTYTLSCEWPDNAFTTLTWTNPTQNTDGTPLTDPGPTRIVRTMNGDINTFDCLDPDASGLTYLDYPHPQQMATFLLAAGDWEFGAYKFNSIGLCSSVSNIATKTVISSVVMADTITFSVPGPITGLDAE